MVKTRCQFHISFSILSQWSSIFFYKYRNNSREYLIRIFNITYYIVVRHIFFQYYDIRYLERFIYGVTLFKLHHVFSYMSTVRNYSVIKARVIYEEIIHIFCREFLRKYIAYYCRDLLSFPESCLVFNLFHLSNNFTHVA